MKFFIHVGTLLIALLHIWFLILEMFLWQKPIGLKIFKTDPNQARITATLAENQGLYNGFLAAGLCWSLLATNEIFAQQLQLFFLSCITIAGIYAGIRVNKRIFWVQAFPALCIIFFLEAL